MNIAGLVPVPFFDDPANIFFAPNLFRFLADMGHAVTVYLPFGEYIRHKPSGAGLPFSLRPLPPRIFRIARHAPVLLASFLAREQYRQGFDVWHSMGDAAGALVLDLVPRKRARIAHIENPANLHGGSRYSMDAISTTLLEPDALARLTGLSQDRIFSIPPAMHGERMQRAFDTVAVRKGWGVMPGTTLLLSVLPTPEGARIDGIARLCSRMHRTDFKWIVAAPGMTTAPWNPPKHLTGRLILVDPAAMLTTVHRDVRRFNAPPRPVLELFAAADLFVLAEAEHRDMASIIQALGARLPVLVPKQADLGQLLCAPSPLLHCPNRDDACMIRTLNGLLDNPAQRRSLGRKSLEFAAGFDWPHIARRYEAMYASVLQSR